ncbi:MAG TPA: hypothetical protein VLA29_06340 [Acidimicrobiia bacterium]|nr:hypothetical protein [Acidimicrobiia bacterium]
MARPGYAAHLVRRFFGHLRARPLTPSEQVLVATMLSPDLHRLFTGQPHQDQRHAFDVASRSTHRSADVLEAALTHDVGKSVAHLGPFGRAAATLWSFTPFRVRGRWQTYLDHGAIGAEMLTGAGATEFTVAFARDHPGPVPPGIDPLAWEALASADDA